MRKIGKIGSGIFLILLLMACSMCSTNKQEESKIELNNLIPGKIDGFTKDGDVEKYTGEEIYRYMDGAGENYRMYDYRSMQVMHLSSVDSNEITIELFDMGDYKNAYGIYTHSREGSDAGFGEGSYSRSGLICFWQGKYFVCLSSLKDTESSRKAIRKIDGRITDTIPPAGKIPEIMSLLPKENRVDETARYFRNYTILNYHYYLADDNLLEIDSTTEACLARYRPGQTYLLCVRYPSAEAAGMAYRRMTSEYLNESDDGGYMEMSDSTWSAVEADGIYLTAVFDAPDRGTAQKLIAEVKENINK